jgi:hypothetical protein
MTFNANCPLCHKPASFEPSPNEALRERRHYRCEHCNIECLLDRWDVERIEQLPSDFRAIVLKEASSVPAGKTLLIEVGEPPTRSVTWRPVPSPAS